MVAQPLDESYFEWLYNQVADPDIENPTLTYWKILRKLYSREFVWTVPHDENRAEDGKQLRKEFIDDLALKRVDKNWMNLGCSVFELMVGLSRRLEFEADGEPHYWFWTLMDNIGISRYSDDQRIPNEKIERILDTIIYRKYKRNGLGGFFPLKHAAKDQRKVELWYQLNAYVREIYENE